MTRRLHSVRQDSVEHDCARTLRQTAPSDSDLGLVFRVNPDTTDADPLDGLAAIASLRRRLDEQADHLALTARRQGASWATIAEALEMSKQGAHQKWGRVAEFAGWGEEAHDG